MFSRKKVKLFAWFILGMLIFAGCGRNEQNKSKEYLIYAVDKDETKVEGFESVIETASDQSTINQLITNLKEAPEKANFKSAIPETVNTNSFELDGNRLTIDFDIAYYEMNPIREVLSRAAIVRTLTQVESVEFINFTVGGEPLTNVSGVQIGLMAADQFVDNAGDQIVSYEKAELTLYFADNDGKLLEPHTVECVYNSNISMDKLVVEQLIDGPKNGENDENGYATIESTTQILSVTTQDGVCYVNLSGDFLVRKGNVTPEVAIYSIVNSLIEIQGINRVQISVEGNSDINYMEKISLSQPFERNMDLYESE